MPVPRWKKAVLNSDAWRVLRIAALSRAGGKCKLCGAEGAGAVSPRVPLVEGGALPGLDGVQVLCASCLRLPRGQRPSDRQAWRELFARVVAEGRTVH